MYTSGGTRYRQFCGRADLIPYPTSEETLLLFVGYLHREKLSHGTMKSYLAAVRFEQISRGMGNPNIASMPKLEYVLRGAKKKTPVSTRQRLPITPQILLRLKQVWKKDPAKRDAQMLWAAACLCFFGFLRSGEVVTSKEMDYDIHSHLCFGDIKVDSRTSPSFLQVRIKASKTDPFRQGVSLYIGAADGPLCPVSAVLSYMVVRGDAPGPLFIWANGRYLTREKFVTGVRRALELAGLDSKRYAGHSFRVGAATIAARCGIQDALIKTLGRWESSAYTRYIRTAPDVLCGVSRTLAASS